MKRLIILLMFLLLPLSAAAAQTTTPDLVENLQKQGFELVSIERSWLRRLVFTFESEELKREIILNPSNGSIMRDYSEPKDDDDSDDDPWYLYLFSNSTGESADHDGEEDD